MTYAYLPAYLSLAEIEHLVAHYQLPNPIVAASFDEFLTHIDPATDRVVVPSMTVFASLIDALAAGEKVPISSIEEPWIDQMQQYVVPLYQLATKIHTARTNRGLARAKAQGKKLGRAYNTPDNPNAVLVQVDALRLEYGISIAEACRRLGCLPSAYHNARRRELK